MQKPQQAVKYTGRKPFKDRLYRSGLTFEPGQARLVPAELARKFLRHADVFEAATEATERGKKKTSTDDTAELLEQAAKDEAQRTEDQNSLQDMFDRVSQMDKEALGQFAKINYQQDLDMRYNVENLRGQVIALIDRFGLV